MIKSVNNYPVSQLFDIEAGVVYAIPRYQREYTWSKAQWESLFDDVQENDPGYFLGSIICINQTTDTLAVQRLEVVDGQQRLTTLSLLFAALYQSLKLHEKDLDDDQRVAEQGMTKETWVDLWKYEGKLFVWTIEHIFPQGDNIPASWVTMIADGDPKKAKTIQETHVHKLGNLTISGFNSALGNKSFKDKRDRTDSKSREVGYKNGLKLNAELATAEGWSVAQIDTRTTTLVDQVMSLFALTEGQPCA